MRKSAAAVLVISLLGSTSAIAQNAGSGTNRVVSFGDSLTDNGNLYTSTGGTTPQSPPYNQRFTNGTTFAEKLNGPMNGFFTPLSNTANTNYAFGGARTDSTLVTPNNGIPGTADQIGAYLLKGGTFGTNTLVTYWAGANNIFQGTAAIVNPATATTFMSGIVQSAANDANAQFNTLATAGAQTVLVYNLPDFGSLPAYTSQGPNGIAIGSFSSTTFNTDLNLATQQAAGAHPGTNFVQIDVHQAFQEILANPAAFGFTNVTAPCVTTPACVTGTFAQQNQYLFWDAVHPTNAGHQLIATLTSMYLYAPSLAAGAAALGEAGFDSRHGLMLDSLDRTRNAQGHIGVTDFGISVYGQADRNRSNTGFAPGVAAPALGANVDATSAFGGLRLQAVRALDTAWTVTADLTALAGNTKAGYVSADIGTFAGDVSARWRQGALFAIGSIGVSADVFSNYKRQTLLGPVVNTTDSIGGYAGSVASEIGYDMGFGALTVTPVARLAWLSASVDAFTEGDLAGIAFNRRTLSALSGTGEMDMRYRISDTTALTALVGYEGFFGKSGDALAGQIANNTAHPFSYATNSLVSPGLQYGVGVERTFGTWTGRLAFRGSTGSHVNEQRADLSLLTKW